MGLSWTVFLLSNVTLHILASLWQSNVGVTLAGRWLFPELYIDLTAHTHCHDFPSDTCYYHCRDEIILSYQQVNSKRKPVSPSAYSISTHLCVHLPLDLKLWVGSEIFGSMLEGPFATPPVLASLESHRKCFAWVWGCLLGKHVHLSCTGIASCRGFWPLPQTAMPMLVSCSFPMQWLEEGKEQRSLSGAVYWMWVGSVRTAPVGATLELLPPALLTSLCQLHVQKDALTVFVRRT